MSTDRREPDYSEVELDDDVRAEQALEEAGGLPEDNPFAEVAEELREDGKDWGQIYDLLEAVFNPVDKAAYEYGWEIQPDWRVAVKQPTRDTPSGYRYEYHEQMAPTADEAERRVGERTALEVEESKTEQIGVSKFC